jgi:hypothetical protein
MRITCWKLKKIDVEGHVVYCFILLDSVVIFVLFASLQFWSYSFILSFIRSLIDTDIDIDIRVHGNS